MSIKSKQISLFVIEKEILTMKTKVFLTGLALIATTSLMVACSNNKSTSTSTTTEQTTEKVSDLKTFIKENKEKIEEYRQRFYLSGMGEDYYKLQSEAEKKDEQVYLTENDVDPRLNKLKVKIGDYNHDTKRLEIIVTNNYSEDLVGYNNDNDGDGETHTSIQIRGYFRERAGVKPAQVLMTILPKKNIKSGETVTFNVLMPYYSITENDKGVPEYQNDTYDSMYILNNYISGTFVYPNTDQNRVGEEAMSNYDNFFTSSSLIFESYPKEASVSDKEIVERYELMQK